MDGAPGGRTAWARVEKQIPRGNDRKKSKGKGNYQYRGLYTALRSGGDDGSLGAPVEMTKVSRIRKVGVASKQMVSLGRKNL
jgi:hypothetical protein